MASFFVNGGHGRRTAYLGPGPWALGDRRRSFAFENLLSFVFEILAAVSGCLLEPLLGSKSEKNLLTRLPMSRSSRGLPTGSAIRCHSSHSCAGACDSGFVDPRLLDVATAGVWDFFLFCSPGFWDVGGLLRALSSPGG